MELIKNKLSAINLDGEMKDALAHRNLHQIESIAQRQINEIASTRSKKRVVIHPSLSPYDQSLLETAYPEFAIEFTQSSHEMHGFAHASRKCEYFRLMERTRRTGAETYSDGSFALIDVGGNEVTHALNSGSNVHVCYPLDDIRDLARSDERQSLIKDIIKNCDSEDTASRMKCYVKTGDKPCRNLCDKYSQFCNAKSDVSISIHAIQHFWNDLAQIMIIHGCKVHHASFMYAPNALYEKHGLIRSKSSDNSNNTGGLNAQWQRRTVNGKEVITFTFGNDPSIGYDQDYKSYVSLLTQSCVVHDQYIVHIERTNVSEGICFLRARLLQNSPQLTPTFNITSGLPFGKLNESYLILGYHTDNADKLIPRSIIAPKKLVDGLTDYCARIDNNVFNLTHLFHIACSINKQLVINGSLVLTRSELRTEELYFLAVCVYVHMYEMKYNAGVSMRKMIKILNRERELREASFFKAFAQKCVDKLTFGMFKEQNMEDPELETITDSLNFNPVASFESKYSKSAVTNFLHHVHASIKNRPPPKTVQIKDAFTGVLLTQYVNLHAKYSEREEILESAENITSRSAILDTLKKNLLNEVLTTRITPISQENLDKELPLTESSTKILRVPEYEIVKCDTPPGILVPVAGDGYCGYTSLTALLLEHKKITISNAELRSTLLSAITKVPNSTTKDSLMTILTTVPVNEQLPSPGWCDINVIAVAAAVYQMNICIHMPNVRNIVINVGADVTAYMHYENYHYQYYTSTAGGFSPLDVITTPKKQTVKKTISCLMNKYNPFTKQDCTVKHKSWIGIKSADDLKSAVMEVIAEGYQCRHVVARYQQVSKAPECGSACVLRTKSTLTNCECFGKETYLCIQCKNTAVFRIKSLCSSCRLLPRNNPRRIYIQSYNKGDFVYLSKIVSPNFKFNDCTLPDTVIYNINNKQYVPHDINRSMRDVESPYFYVSYADVLRDIDLNENFKFTAYKPKEHFAHVYKKNYGNKTLNIANRVIDGMSVQHAIKNYAGAITVATHKLLTSRLETLKNIVQTHDLHNSESFDNIPTLDPVPQSTLDQFKVMKLSLVDIKETHDWLFTKDKSVENIELTELKTDVHDELLEMDINDEYIEDDITVSSQGTSEINISTSSVCVPELFEELPLLDFGAITPHGSSSPIVSDDGTVFLFDESRAVECVTVTPELSDLDELSEGSLTGGSSRYKELALKYKNNQEWIAFEQSLFGKTTTVDDNFKMMNKDRTYTTAFITGVNSLNVRTMCDVSFGTSSELPLDKRYQLVMICDQINHIDDDLRASINLPPIMALLARLPLLLSRDGDLFMKVYIGYNEQYDTIINVLATHFGIVKIVKSNSSSFNSEYYFIGRKYFNTPIERYNVSPVVDTLDKRDQVVKTLVEMYNSSHEINIVKKKCPIGLFNFHNGDEIILDTIISLPSAFKHVTDVVNVLPLLVTHHYNNVDIVFNVKSDSYKTYVADLRDTIENPVGDYNPLEKTMCIYVCNEVNYIKRCKLIRSKCVIIAEFEHSKSTIIFVRADYAVLVVTKLHHNYMDCLREEMGVPRDLLVQVSCGNNRSIRDDMVIECKARYSFSACGYKTVVNAEHAILGYIKPLEVPEGDGRLQKYLLSVTEKMEIEKLNLSNVLNQCVALWESAVKSKHYVFPDSVIARTGAWLWKKTGVSEQFIGKPQCSSYMFAYDGERLIPVAAEVVTNGTHKTLMVVKGDTKTPLALTCSDGFYLFFNDLSIFVSPSLIASYEIITTAFENKDYQNNSVVSNLANCKFKIVQGSPGCGKTTYIIKNHKLLQDCISTQTKAARQDVYDRICKNDRTLVGNKTLNFLVRTLDSIVMRPMDLKGSTLFVDEAMMAHAGDIITAVGLTGCSEVCCVGDALQIPYINRVGGYATKHHKLDYIPVDSHLNKTYRCPRDVVRFLNPKYPAGITGVNTNDDTMTTKHIPNIMSVPLRADVQYLTFTQHEKQQLYEHAKKMGTKIKVMSVHESQGSEFKHVIIVRLNQVISNPVFKSDNHIVVALSRHTQSLQYLIATLKSDTVSDLIVRNSRLSGGATSEVHAPLITANIGNYKHHQLLEQNGMWGTTTSAVTEVASLLNDAKTEVITHVESMHHVAIQTFIDEAFPGGMIVDMDNVAYQSSICDVDFHLPSGTIYSPDRIVELKSCKKTGGFTPVIERPILVSPVLTTSIQPNRERTQLNSLEAVLSRNGDVPTLSVDVDVKRVAELTVLKFFDSYVRPDAIDAVANFVQSPVTINQNDLYHWSQRVSKKIMDPRVGNFGLHEQQMNNYAFQIKPEVKPKIDATSHLTVQVLQTIAAHPQEVTQIMSPIFKVISQRIQSVLRSNVCIFADDSPDVIMQQINTHRKHFDTDMYTTEIDISKYDKSQGQLALEIDCLLLKLFGVDQFYVELWRDAHVKSRLNSKSYGFSFPTLFQRKSGDAWTFGGNTLLTMCVVAATLDIASDDFYSRVAKSIWGIERGTCVNTRPSVSFAMFAGDDSLVLSSSRLSVDSQKVMTDLYNFETKLFKFNNSMYFCSKFVIDIGGEYVVVPDPIKTMFKLGRKSLRDYTHVEEYRVSLYDLFRNLRDPVVRDLAVIACIDRYQLTVSPSAAIAAVLHYVCDSKEFSKLFTYTSYVNRVITENSAFFGTVPKKIKNELEKNGVRVNPRGGNYVYRYTNGSDPNMINVNTDYPFVFVSSASREVRRKFITM